MSFSVFCNISRYLLRNLSLFKLQQGAPLRKTHKTRFSIVATLRETHSWAEKNSQSCTTTTTTTVLAKESIRWKENDGYYWSFSCLNGKGAVMMAAMSFSLFTFGKSDDEAEETPEDKLITTIKRSILCIQREQYDRAEQMLHLALRMAQDLQSREGVTYVYDIMANLAMEREQFKKAEKLFRDVMQRLLQEGHAQDSPQLLHISAKLAHMAQLQGELEKSAIGFEWTLQKIAQKLKEMPDDRDLHELLGLTKNWHGQLLMKMGKYVNAKKAFKESFKCLTEIYGFANEEAITILNNLSVACVNLDEFDEAKEHLTHALKLVKELKDSTQESILEANLGLVFLREGLLREAKDHCTTAYRMAKKQKNIDATEQAEYCLDEIKAFSHQK